MSTMKTELMATAAKYRLNLIEKSMKIESMGLDFKSSL